MVWVHRNFPKGFEELSRAEMLSAGLEQVSDRFFSGSDFDLSSSAYAGFTVEEISRGATPEEAIKNFDAPIPSPFRVEKMIGTKRSGSRSLALTAYNHLEGDIQGSNPASIIMVFSPDNDIWIAGFLSEKDNSIIERMKDITERTCVSLTSQAALAMIRLAPEGPIVDPCCGTGLIPIASLLSGKETHTADKNFKMLRKARLNRDLLNLDIDMPYKDAMSPWIEGCCLVSDFPAERSWTSITKDISLELFRAWIPFITSFCIILPNRVLDDLPEGIYIRQRIEFTADRTILIGVTSKPSS